MNAFGVGSFAGPHEPPFRQGAEGPAGAAILARAHLLESFDVQFDGRVYRCGDQRFQHFTDALAHARQALGARRSTQCSPPHRRQPAP